MANLLFTRTENSNSVPFVDGQIIIDETSGKISLDSVKEDEDKRIEVGGRMTVDSNLDKKSDNPIQNKAVANALIETMESIRLTNQTGKIASALAVKQLEADLKANFQNGVDSVYNACVVAGATPKSKSVTDIVNAIGKISQIFYLGEGTSFDIKKVFPDDYQKLTNDNFIVCSVGGTVYGDGHFQGVNLKGGSYSVNPWGQSYNQQTGILTLKGGSGGGSKFDSVEYNGVSCDYWIGHQVNLKPPKVYLVAQDILGVADPKLITTLSEQGWYNYYSRPYKTLTKSYTFTQKYNKVFLSTSAVVGWSQEDSASAYGNMYIYSVGGANLSVTNCTKVDLGGGCFLLSDVNTNSSISLSMSCLGGQTQWGMKLTASLHSLQ